jgi:hypothetical protein
LGVALAVGYHHGNHEPSGASVVPVMVGGVVVSVVRRIYGNYALCQWLCLVAGNACINVAFGKLFGHFHAVVAV